MNDATRSARKLAQDWRDLVIEIKKNKMLKFELFETTFSQTYSLLLKHSEEKSLDKNYIEMIAEAFLFANIKDEALDDKCLAAFVLTERMLTHCAFSTASASVETSMIYAVEARRDILLDFNNVGESISKLTKIFEGIYWKKVKS